MILSDRPDDGVRQVDRQTIKACREYANNNPWHSIPLERQEWLEAQGFDYKNYDYYQDCINQKLPINQVKIEPHLEIAY